MSFCPKPVKSWFIPVNLQSIHRILREIIKKSKNLLAANQGYTESESTYGQKPTTQNAAGRSSSFVLRVPVGNYENFIDGISSIGELESKNLYTQDISSNYYDNEARIEVLEERKDRLMEHLQAATDMEDVIALEAELSDVLYDLDQLKGSQRGMDKQVDLRDGQRVPV